MSVATQVLSRRRFLLGGSVLVATALIPAVHAQGPGVVSVNGGRKPTFLPAPGSTDPVAHSVAEQMFWGEQMMEHAVFLTMFMPGDDLAQQRAEADRFKKTFEARLAGLKSAPLTKDSYVASNEAAVKETRDFMAFKRGLIDAQASGKVHTLAWPTFLDHISREEDHLVQRLGRLSGGDTSYDRVETDKFWSLIMGEHADFIVHLLDPTEKELIAKAQKTGETFYTIHKS